MITYICKKFYDLTLDELYEILKLRQEVFVVEQDCVYQDNDDKDQTAYHLFGRDTENEIVCYTRILPKNISFKGYVTIGRVINSNKIRGKGEGKKLMRQSIATCKNLFPGSPIKISAQSYLEKFYKSLRFTTVGEEYMEDGIPHVAMVLT